VIFSWKYPVDMGKDKKILEISVFGIIPQIPAGIYFAAINGI